MDYKKEVADIVIDRLGSANYGNTEWINELVEEINNIYSGNFRELLKRYMDLVVKVHFHPALDLCFMSMDLTGDDMIELRKIEAEIKNDPNN